MKKSIRVGALIGTLIMLMLMIVSCGNKNLLLGKWSYQAKDGIKFESTLEFIDDESGKMTLGSAISVEFKYTYKDDQITMTSEVMGEKSEDTYKVVSVDSDKLVLIEKDKDGNESEVTLEKVD